MIKHLNEDEDIFYLFVGQKNANPLDICSSCIIALTNKRIMVATKRVLFGYFFKSITPDMYNDMEVYQGLLFGKVIIDTLNEKVSITNVDKKALPEIETAISSYMMEAKQKYQNLNQN